MCAQYWNVRANVTCPFCGHGYRGELQTHWYGGGDGTWCDNYYELGERVPALGNMTVTLDENSGDGFIDGCPKCKKFIDFGAEIVNGAVVRVWPLNKTND